MNLLAVSLSTITNLYPNKAITILAKEQTIKDGDPLYKDTRLNTFAHMQPIEDVEAQRIEGMTSGMRAFKFWLLGDNIQTIAMQLNLKRRDSIICEGVTYTILKKHDWSANGWIEIDAYLREDA